MNYNRKIVLEDGQEYYGCAFGSDKDKICEIVFNTSMVGYQEILSDPSYTGQAVVMTYPLIGNYGMAAEDYESDTPSCDALIVREYNDHPSNFRSEKTLSEVMASFGISGICGVDTRKLTRSIRDFGSRKAMLCDAGVPVSRALEKLSATALRKDVVSQVSCRKKILVPAREEELRVVAIDCGMKKNIVRSFLGRHVSLTIVPWNTCWEEIHAFRPDGIFLSNGPGDPTDVPETVNTVKNLIGRYPIFGICLGHQILALAYGAQIYKLKFGHRGGNHPVKNLMTGKIEITSQNHSYAVREDSLSKTPLEVTHLNLLDGTVEGIQCLKDGVFSVQYHPESAPGPQDSSMLFDRFVRNMKEGCPHA